MRPIQELPDLDTSSMNGGGGGGGGGGGRGFSRGSNGFSRGGSGGGGGGNRSFGRSSKIHVTSPDFIYLFVLSSSRLFQM